MRLADVYGMTIDAFLHYDDPNYKRPAEPKEENKVVVTVALNGNANRLRQVFERLTAI